jgi:hypothetical protein
VSYILDAPKKSEAERSRGVVPTLLTPLQTTFRSSIIGWGLVVALIVNAGLFAAWLYWPAALPRRRCARRSRHRSQHRRPLHLQLQLRRGPIRAAAPQQDTVAEPESPLETAVMPQPIPVALADANASSTRG